LWDRFGQGEVIMKPIKLDATQLLGFSRDSTVSAKIGIPKTRGAKVGPVKKAQSAKIGFIKVQAK
jgi:hypothetical protein